jgi:KipI family sensor histidine kinase inhibitor
VIDLVPLAESAWLARFATEVEAAAWAVAVREAQAGLPGVNEVVLAYRSVAVFAEPERSDPEAIESMLRAILASRFEATLGPIIEIPVMYDGDDLDDVAVRLGLSRDAVIAAHSGSIYTVFALGFQPGFPYAGYLPEVLSGLARRGAPRPRVPAGSVAIAGVQTAIYPQASPGGWHLLGRTPLRIVDLGRALFPIRAGDRLRFVPIDDARFAERAGEFLHGPDREPVPTGGESCLARSI